MRSPHAITGLVLTLGLLAPSRAATGDGSLRDTLRERLRNRFQGSNTTESGRQGSILERIRSRQAQPGERLELAGRPCCAWRPSPAAPRPYPLVLFSHGFHGAARQSSALTAALARAGYLVLAPDHADAIGLGSLREKPQMPLGDPARWTDRVYRDRAEDLHALVKALRADPEWNRTIDWARVALAGHSLGGYTVLGLAGGWPSWKLKEARAVLALSPYASPFNHARTLGALGVPVMYQTGTRDLGVAPFVCRAGGSYDQTASPAVLVSFEGAGHFAWTDLNLQFQESIARYCLAFLDHHLRGGPDAGLKVKGPGVAELRSR